VGPLCPWARLLFGTLWFAARLPLRLPLSVLCLRRVFVLSWFWAHRLHWLSGANLDPIRWTLARLQQWIEQVFGLSCSHQTIRRVLVRLGFSWKKARKLLAKACPQRRQEFLQDLKSLMVHVHNGRILLVYCDEAHIHLEADLGYGWGRRGLPLFVHSTSPGLQKVSFYGLYLYNYQTVRIWPYPCANSDHTMDMLTRLRQQFPDHIIVLVWDNASYHRSGEVRDKAAQLGITLLPLPAYSPDLMPVEALWRWLRQEVTYVQCHLSGVELIENAEDFASSVNLDPIAVATRLRVKTHLDPREEKLRFSNGL
jgi:transposase